MGEGAWMWAWGMDGCSQGPARQARAVGGRLAVCADVVMSVVAVGCVVDGMALALARSR